MTETNLPPIEAVVAAARKRAGDNPEFVYESRVVDGEETCVYVEEQGGQLVGSCLLGHALIDAGLNPTRLMPFNQANAWIALPKLGYAENGSLSWLAQAQAGQDCQKPWSEAVAAADAVYPGLAA